MIAALAVSEEATKLVEELATDVSRRHKRRVK